jgi:carboxyl-terminal processing protease
MVLRFAGVRRFFMIAVGSALLAGHARAADGYSQRDLAEAARLVSRVHIAKPDISTLPSDSAASLSAALKLIDPYTELVPPSRLPLLKEEKTRARGLGGVFELAKDGKAVFIPLPGGPAAAASLDEPLALSRIDDVDVAGKTVAEIEALVAGKTVVKIEGKGLRTDGNRAFSIPVDGFMVDGATVSEVSGVEVIRIDFFIRGETAQRVTSAVERARLAGRPILIDLRYSTGGDLEEAVQSLAALGMGGVGSIVESNEGERNEIKYAMAGDGSGVSVYIAVTHLTASAAEVFAGALLEEGRALLIGETTYGKCLAQRVFDLPDGAGIRVSTGRLYLPSGTPCAETGLVPDVSMDATVHDIAGVVERARSSGAQRVCASPAKGEVLPGAATLGGKVWRGRPGKRQCISPALGTSGAQAAEQLLRLMEAKVAVEDLFPSPGRRPKAITTTPTPKATPTTTIPIPKPKPATRPPAQASASAAPSSGGWYFIVSLHLTKDTAELAATEAKTISPNAPVLVETIRIGGMPRHQVIVGPFTDRAVAKRTCTGKAKPLSASCADDGIYFQRDGAT